MMTEDEMERVTLKDIETLAARFGAAVKTIKEAQGMFAPPPPPSPLTEVVPVATTVVATPNGVGMIGRQPVQWTPEEQALQDAMRQARQKALEDLAKPDPS